MPEPGDIGDLYTPDGMQTIIEWSNLHTRARIVTFRLTKEQAERICDRLWPNESLLGATCGKGFRIETPEQVAAINEILQPEISIGFNQEHVWMLQTWPGAIEE